MRPFVLAAWLALLGISGVAPVLADGAWPMTGHDPANTSFNSGERVLGPRTVAHLHLAWRYRHPVSALVVAGSRAYAVAPAGVLVLDARTGKTLHLFTSRQLGIRPGLVASGLAYSRGDLVFVTSQAIVALNATTGRVIWRRSVRFSTNLSIAGDIVYTGSYCFNGCPTYALRLRTGTEVWANPTGGVVQSVVGGRVYEGLLWHGYCQDRIFDAGTGALIATLGACGSWTGDAGHTYGLVFPTDTDKPAALESVPADGTPGAWTVPVGRPEASALVFAYGTLFAPTASPREGIVAVRARDGAVLWRRTIHGTVHILAANHLLFVLHRGARVEALRTDNGKLVRRLYIPHGRGQSLFGGLVAGGRLYASIGKSTVVMQP